MNKYLTLSFVWTTMVALSCGDGKPAEETNRQEKAFNFRKTIFEADSNFSYRGLCVVDSNVVWISGTQGVFLRTTNGCHTWNGGFVPGAGKMDFRDVEAFNKDTALVMNAGFPGKIYKTTDGGENWKETYSNMDSAIFLDGFDFWDQNNGIAFGDPMNGRLLILITHDGGDSWEEIKDHCIPGQMPVEGGFAASGTSVVAWDNSHALIGVGGTQARIYSGLFTDANWDDGCHSWSAENSPIISGNASRGIYSISMGPDGHGVAVGGAWNEDSLSATKAYTIDNGIHWQLSEGAEAYRSGSCYVKDLIFLATGPSGTDITTDGGKTWKLIDEEGFNCIEFDKTGSAGFAVGAKGKMAKVAIW